MENRNFIITKFKSTVGQGNIPVDSSEIYLRSNLGRLYPFERRTRNSIEGYLPKKCTKQDDFKLYLECIKDGIKDKDEKKVKRNLSKLVAGGIVQYLQLRKAGCADLGEEISRLSRKTGDGGISKVLKQIIEESNLNMD